MLIDSYDVKIPTVVPPVALTSVTLREVAVKIPTPKIFLLLPFKSPPNFGVVSPTIVVVIPVRDVNG